MYAALLIAVGASVTTLLYSRLGFYDDPAPIWLTVIVVAALSLPLAVRRRFPEVVAIVVSIVFFVGQQFSVPELLFSNISLFIAIYTVGAWGRNRRVANYLRIAIIIGMFLWVAVNLVVTVSDPSLMPGISRAGIFSQFASYALINVITNILYFGGAYYFGNTAYAAARQRAELEARTSQLAAERERTSEQAVALDRVRIARELHDVVAHHVSVMGVQAGAARRVLESDPAQASASLSTIEMSARAAVDELHKLLATLRDTATAESGSDAANVSSSTRGVGQLGELVAESTGAGLPTTLTVIGDERPVTGLVGFTVYRLAQESLTNTRKHGGERATADVRLRYLDDGIELEVTDTGLGRISEAGGRTHGPGSTPGLGHLGMRERVAAVGGEIEFGPRNDGGYLVRARLPLAAAPVAVAIPAPVPAESRSATGVTS